LFAVLCVSAFVVRSASLEAAPQQPGSDVFLSLERIREQLEKPPPRQLTPDVPVQLAVATFKTRVDQRVFVPSLAEHLHKEFDLNPLQRQSAEWASKCCGFNLGQLAKSVNDALRDRRIRKTREQIARELAELDAARAAAAQVK
jgi:hypothetical protein